MLKKTFVLMLLFLAISSFQPANAQKTTQKASKPQVFVMVIFAAVGIKVLSYFRIP